VWAFVLVWALVLLGAFVLLVGFGPLERSDLAANWGLLLEDLDLAVD
jgi:hypothetical protein